MLCCLKIILLVAEFGVMSRYMRKYRKLATNEMRLKYFAHVFDCAVVRSEIFFLLYFCSEARLTYLVASCNFLGLIRKTPHQYSVPPF